MRHFCTLLNSAYQYHAHLLYDSISKFYPEFKFYIFCFDEVSINYFKKASLKNAALISNYELEQKLPGLNKVKATRSVAEYFFTCTPAICKYLFEQYEDVEEVVYLDADIFFYQSPEIIFKEINGYSIAIVPHRFNFLNYFRNIYGYYNVGWVSFKKDNQGLPCLNSWYNNTITWCFDKLTLTKYADQKYLNRWRKNFDRVYIIKNRGVNVAPWNVGNAKITIHDSSVYIGNVPLVFYHFASLKFIDNSYYTTISSNFTTLKPEVKNAIYVPYLNKLISLGFRPKDNLRLNRNLMIKIVRKWLRFIFKDTIVIKNASKAWTKDSSVT